jgi:hypothetical protein
VQGYLDGERRLALRAQPDDEKLRVRGRPLRMKQPPLKDGPVYLDPLMMAEMKVAGMLSPRSS